jgi:hypothetical protein
MHMTVRATGTATFPVKLGLRLESPKSIPAKNSDVLNKSSNKVITPRSQRLFNEPKIIS